jgi:transcriptional regulator with XRE-family HTH domain
MADRGFGFSQATIWKIERGERPVRASELVALAGSLGVMSATSLMTRLLTVTYAGLVLLATQVSGFHAPVAVKRQPRIPAAANGSNRTAHR